MSNFVRFLLRNKILIGPLLCALGPSRSRVFIFTVIGKEENKLVLEQFEFSFDTYKKDTSDFKETHRPPPP